MQGQIKRFSRDQAQGLDTVLHLVDYSLHVELVVGAELPNEGDIVAFDILRKRTVPRRKAASPLTSDSNQGTRGLWNQFAGRPDPNTSYYYDPRTGQVYAVAGGQTALEQWRQAYLSGQGGGGVKPWSALFGPNPQSLALANWQTRRRRGW